MPRTGRGNGTGKGKPKGYKAPQTLEKEAMRQRVRELVCARLDEMTRAQIASAVGIAHFFLRDSKTGQFERITDEKLIEAALNSGDEGSYYYIFTKDPSVQAYTDLMNRAVDKPKEQEQEHHHEGTLELIVKKPW